MVFGQFCVFGFEPREAHGPSDGGCEGKAAVVFVHEVLEEDQVLGGDGQVGSEDAALVAKGDGGKHLTWSLKDERSWLRLRWLLSSVSHTHQ